MGVPAFYRWLTEKYPKIVQDVLEERVQTVHPDSTVRLAFDATKPNPSGLECDNLYIDMNGIIHPCSHPETGPQPVTEQDMYEGVCRYVDRLMRAIRPRKLLYLAIDGVAPRAKMNQQRARRFRSAQEARELAEMEAAVRVEWSSADADGDHDNNTPQAPPPSKEPWDSNVITPGTPFMLRLADYIRFYIRLRLSTDPAWKNLLVLFSDASIPGEGEHKIMNHVRLQRAQPGYSPNTVHVLHGLDADLIMLALATHEAHFYISREEVLFGRQSQEMAERRQMESGHRDAQRALDEAAGPNMGLPENAQKPLQRVSIPILREYLAAEMAPCLDPRRLGFAPSLERLLDDFVFLCFFVGNDFLPHLPSLDIRDGALDFLLNVYKRVLPGLGDYITKSGGNVNLSHVDVILAEVGAMEDYVFGMKHQNELREQERRQRHKGGPRKQEGPPPPPAQQEPPKVQGRAARILEASQSKGKIRQTATVIPKAKAADKDENDKAAMALKQALFGSKEEEQEEEVEAKPESESQVVNPNAADDAVKELPEKQETETKKRKSDETKKLAPGVVGEAEDEFDADDDDDDDEEEDAEDDEDELVDKTEAPKVEDFIQVIDPAVAKAFKEKVKSAQHKKLDEYARNIEDKVRLHEAGWKDRYYTDKCKADDVSAHGGREHLFRSYVVGLCWVMKYYYDGCPSWKWYYPFHYAPFASDLKNIERFQKDCRSFEIARPFAPVEQLMAVLPPESSHAIPKEARWLMLDRESPILDFYPTEVPVDPNGKAMPWLWVVLLPFIDEDRLLAAMSPTMTKWEKEELLANARGLDDGYLFVHKEHSLVTKLRNVLAPGRTANASKTRLTDTAAYGCASFNGFVRPPLSHELYPIDEESVVPPPPGASKIDVSEFESMFATSIDPNDAVCVAFSEPAKLSHKSVLLPGAKLLKPHLTADDKRIRRPRLNRGGATIANMGLSNGRSDQTGYGSMNVSQYERDLAQRTGRGHEMNQTGMRAWGAMEPTAKRPRGPPPPPPPPQMPNPLMNQGRGQQPPHWQGYANGPGYNQQQGGPQYPPQRMPGQNYGYGHSQQHNQQQQQPYRGGGQQPNPGYGQQRQGYQQQPPNRPPPQQQQQGFNFRAYNQPPAPPGYQHRPPAQQAAPRSRASADVMNSLKAQLTSTLKQNRRSGGK